MHNSDGKIVYFSRCGRGRIVPLIFGNAQNVFSFVFEPMFQREHHSLVYRKRFSRYRNTVITITFRALSFAQNNVTTDNAFHDLLQALNPQCNASSPMEHKITVLWRWTVCALSSLRGPIVAFPLKWAFIVPSQGSTISVALPRPFVVVIWLSDGLSTNRPHRMQRKCCRTRASLRQLIRWNGSPMETNKNALEQ